VCGVSVSVWVLRRTDDYEGGHGQALGSRASIHNHAVKLMYFIIRLT